MTIVLTVAVITLSVLLLATALYLGSLLVLDIRVTESKLQARQHDREIHRRVRFAKRDVDRALDEGVRRILNGRR